ncbi:MAG TPA: hypothetical protein VF476_12125 [Chitinophagaceae bacterium]
MPLQVRYWLLFFLLPLLSFHDNSEVPAKKKIKILYVGNSLTYSNDLPAIVKEMGQKDGVTINYESILFANYALEDHWNDGKVKEEIEKGNYDFVVMQQGPSAAPESQGLLELYAKMFAQTCYKVKTVPVLYMVWPSKARSFDMDNVIKSYSNAAERTNSVLAPAGLAWKNAWQKDGTLPLYSEDDFHPSVTGTVLAALTVYGAVTLKKEFDFLTKAKTSWRKEISAANWNILAKAALQALNIDEQEKTDKASF